MHIVGTPKDAPRRATPVEVADLELRGVWVVDVRRTPGQSRGGDRAGWLVAWEDDIVFLTDSAEIGAEEASEQFWPPDAA